jgi:hypothetical protein
MHHSISHILALEERVWLPGNCSVLWCAGVPWLSWWASSGAGLPAPGGSRGLLLACTGGAS